jgi:hypothetical protein
MRLLRLVGPSADGGALVVETADGGEQFTLPINERLRNVSTSDLPRLPVPDSAAGDAPSPREIQTRVRAGASAQEVADEAGIPLDRVMRFAFPVLQERIRVVDEARRARARSHEGQLTEFGQLVDARFAQHGIDPAGIGWDAYRRADGGWTVTAALTANEQPLLAKFSFALVNRTVSALDALAADLLSDRPVQALLPPMPTPVVAEPEPADRAGAPPRLAAVPDPDEPTEDPAAGAIATLPSSAIRPGRRQKAHTRPIPVSDDDELFDQDAFDPNALEPAFRHSAPDQPAFEPSGSSLRASQDRPVDPTRAPIPRPAGRGQHARDWQDAALPLELEADLPSSDEPDGDGRGRRNRRGDKPRMPSWDDILLGVRHKSE